jgi:hypothetical protein
VLFRQLPTRTGRTCTRDYCCSLLLLIAADFYRPNKHVDLVVSRL